MSSRLQPGNGNIHALKEMVLQNPYIPLCTPPVLGVLQFMLILAIFGGGVPDYMTKSKMTSIPLTGALFGLSAFSIPAIMLGVRNLIYSPHKVAPALGIALNAVYLIGFVGFFLMLIVLKVN